MNGRFPRSQGDFTGGHPGLVVVDPGDQVGASEAEGAGRDHYGERGPQLPVGCG